MEKMPVLAPGHRRQECRVKLLFFAMPSKQQTRMLPVAAGQILVAMYFLGRTNILILESCDSMSFVF